MATENTEKLMKEIEDIKKQIKKINDWIAKREKNQLQIPLDQRTKDIINRYT